LSRSPRARELVVSWIFVASVAWGCVPPPDWARAEWTTTEADWQAARERLDALRRTEPDDPYGVVVRVSLREPKSGRVFEARGALAVDPRRALRMILIGPGGATALDAWVTNDAYRFEVPPIGLLRRGGAKAEPTLPVGFFREWFLSPFAGRLLASTLASTMGRGPTDLPACKGRWFILRHGEGTVTLCDQERQGSLDILAIRKTNSSLEELTFRGKSLTPSPGDRAEYADKRSRVRATVEVESIDETPPDPVAFLDPEHGGAR
jgi:hypothetical protein